MEFVVRIVPEVQKNFDSIRFPVTASCIKIVTQLWWLEHLLPPHSRPVFIR